VICDQTVLAIPRLPLLVFVIQTGEVVGVLERAEEDQLSAQFKNKILLLQIVTVRLNLDGVLDVVR